MAEVWKPVPSLSGVMASSLGRILLPPSHRPVPNGGFRLYKTKPTFGSVKRSKAGAEHEYFGVWTTHFGNIKVHRAVCEAFHGAPPKGKMIVLHLDENALNNAPENLKWGTQAENLNAAGFIAYCKTRTGDRSPASIGRQRASL